MKRIVQDRMFTSTSDGMDVRIAILSEIKFIVKPDGLSKLPRAIFLQHTFRATLLKSCYDQTYVC
jgi:hypothetical protein